MQEKTPLERMLEDAWREPGLRPAFYKRLLESMVLIAVQPRPGQVHDGVIGAGENLAVISLVRTDGVEVIPFYTSPGRVFEGSPMGERCVTMTARVLFEMRPDTHFHINPFSPYGREFTPWEVRSLLGTGGIAVQERIGIPDSDDLGPPQQVPERVLEALRVLFARNFDVRAAYLAQRYGPAAHEYGTLLITVDLAAGGDQVRALREAGTVISEVDEPGMPTFSVAVLPRDGSAISRYFLEQATPFYSIGLAGSIAAALKMSAGAEQRDRRVE